MPEADQERHLFKRLVRRRRPDRSIGAGRRRGIPRSGNAWDSFPSGHALHLGAIAGTLCRLVPPRLRPLVWPGVISLASSRVLLLAHYPSDVAAGLLMGAFLDKALAPIAAVDRASTPRRPWVLPPRAHESSRRLREPMK